MPQVRLTDKGLHVQTSSTAKVIRLPLRDCRVIWVSSCCDGGWIVQARDHGWAHGSSVDAIRDATWLSQNLGLRIHAMANAQSSGKK
jgi:hypothetical protein